MVVFLRAVDAAESDTFRVLVVQDFDGVAVEDGDDGAGEVSSERETCSTHAGKDYEERSWQEEASFGRPLFFSQAMKMARHRWPPTHQEPHTRRHEACGSRTNDGEAARPSCSGASAARPPTREDQHLIATLYPVPGRR